MRVRVLYGLAAIAAAFVGCSKSSDQTSHEAKAPAAASPEAPSTAVAEENNPASPDKSAMGQPAEPGATEAPAGETQNQQPQQQPQQTGSHELVMGTFSCLLGPVMGTPHEPASSAHGTGGANPAAMGPDSERCAGVAKAANVDATGVYKGEPAALDTVRRTLDSRLSAEGVSTEISNNTLAFFDKGVASAKEARASEEEILKVRAQAYMVSKKASSTKSGTSQKPPAASPELASTIRAHRDLAALYQFGRNLGMTEVGTEAQSLAWIIGSQRFMSVPDVPTSLKPAAAEPLFDAILNVEPPAPTAGHAAPSWNEYLAAAARSVGGSTNAKGHGVGGGPSAANAEKANLAEIAKAANERMQMLGQQLPAASELRADVDQTAMEMKTRFEAPPASPAPKAPAKPAPKNAPSK